MNLRWCMKCEHQKRWRSPLPYCPMCIRSMSDEEVVAAHFKHCKGDNPMLQMAKWLPEKWDRERFRSAVVQALMFGLISEDEFFARHPDYDRRDEECE